MILRPRLSEKTYASSQMLNVYVFDVPGDASKQAIATAVEDQFDVKTTNVRTANIKGKTKRVVLGRGRKSKIGKRSDFKKAYVTLAEGNSLPIFAAIEEADKKAEKAEKAKAKEKKK